MTDMERCTRCGQARDANTGNKETTLCVSCWLAHEGHRGNQPTATGHPSDPRPRLYTEQDAETFRILNANLERQARELWEAKRENRRLRDVMAEDAETVKGLRKDIKLLGDDKIRHRKDAAHLRQMLADRDAAEARANDEEARRHGWKPPSPD